MYHYVRPLKDSKYPGIKGLEFQKFKQQLDFVEKNYDIIEDTTLPFDKKPWLTRDKIKDLILF
jgi:hypothetical protein